MRKKLHFRYWLSFIILIILLGVLVFWNINSGSIPISLQDVFRIIFLRDGTKTAYNIIWEIRLPRILAAVILGGALVRIRIFASDFFWKPDRGTFCPGNLFRCQTDRGTDDDLSSREIYCGNLGRDDHCCFHRFHDFHGLCAPDRKESQSDVYAGYQRYHDRIYLFSSDGFCGDFCG